MTKHKHTSAFNLGLPTIELDTHHRGPNQLRILVPDLQAIALNGVEAVEVTAQIFQNSSGVGCDMYRSSNLIVKARLFNNLIQ
jgi:hypothetical protein